jgi:tetratricopeptide (TPR) repeat protein
LYQYYFYQVLSLQKQWYTTSLSDGPAINDIEVTYSYEPSKNPHSGDTAEILETYRNKFQKATFLLPIGAFQVISNLLERESPLLLLSGDQGVATEKQIEQWAPDLDKHGSFSMPVDYLAIGELSKRTNGQTWLTPNPDTQFIIQLSTWPKKDYTLTQNAFAKLSTFEPVEYWRLGNTLNGGSLDDILTACEKGLGDPVLIFEHHKTLCENIEKIDKQRMHKLLKRCRENLFPICPEESGVFVNLGVLFYLLGFLTDAQACFQKALDWNPNDALAKKNLTRT